jgi:putative oxidoreductase
MDTVKIMKILNLMGGAAAPSGAQTLVGDVGLLVLRLWAGGVMALAHGFPKIDRLSQDPIQFADPLGIGVTASLVCTILTELVGGALIALGLLTRAATISLVFTFLVVVFVVKWGKGFGEMELGATFLAMYVILLLTGPGRLSLDYLISSRKAA